MIETVNRICAQLPPGWTIELCMTHPDYDGVCVNLINPHGGFLDLPDTSDKTIVEQLDEMLVPKHPIIREKRI